MKMKLNPSQRLLELRAEMNSILDKGIAQFLEPWANTKTPMYIYIQGYTPSFNDGEPCTHASYEYNKDEIIEDEDILYCVRELHESLTEEELLNSADWPRSKEFYQSLEGVNEALEYHYGTDYHLLITLKDGQVSYIKDNYDCTY